MSKKTFTNHYLTDLADLLPRLDRKLLDKAIRCLQTARDQGRSIYTCGNGGSSSIASQMVVDIVKGSSYGHEKRFKMISLTDSIATVTAYANDVSYDCVFAEQLKNYAQKGDVLIAISGSGNSANVIKAAEYANSVGCTTIGMTTSEGGKLGGLCKIPLLVPSSHMGRLEDCFFIMTHVLCYAFMERVY